MVKKILRHKVVSGFFLTSLSLVLGGSLWAYFSLRGVSGVPLILHFDDIGGITSVGSLGTLVFMGVFGIIVVMLNFFIALEFEERDRFLGKAAAAVTFIFALLLFIAFAAIINVN